MGRPRLHLDADTFYQALQKALQKRGHDATRTPTAWMPLEATDREQLLEATARGRDYYEGGAVAEMIRRGNQLMAEVEGVNMSHTWSRLPL